MTFDATLRMLAGRATQPASRYIAGAGLCALANNVVLIAADALGYPLLAGVLLTWLTGGTIGYIWHARITYGRPLDLTAYGRFLAGAMVGIPLAWAVLWLLAQALGWPMVYAAPATTVVLFCYHWLNARLAITRRQPRAARIGGGTAV